MSTELSPAADTYHSTVTAPSDGDAANGTNFQAGIQDCADNARYVRDRCPGAAASTVIIIPPQIATPDLDGYWDLLGNYQRQNDVSTSHKLYYPVVMPPDGTITQVRCLVTGTGGHSALPANMPILRLYSLDSTGTTTQEGTVTDTSADLGAYETVHWITLSGLSVSLGQDAYHVDLLGESGANALADKLVAYQVEITVTNA